MAGNWKRIVLVGEPMLELSRAAGSQREDIWRMGYGGDTLNTAIHLARAGHNVAYLTALGEDAHSEHLKVQWQAEGLDTSLVLAHPARSPGLYAIDTDRQGERRFTYWRDASAAREMFVLSAMNEALARAGQADLLGFSLVSLAILSDSDRTKLLALAGQVRTRGGKVAFDGNYRPRLWSCADEARHWRDRAIACADFGLPTLDDEAQLGTVDADAVLRHWLGLGCAETVVKLGQRGCLLSDGAIVAPGEVLAPVDTSGAGDAFNAGYLGARLDGSDCHEAARAGHALSAWTIMRPGAIPARDS